MEKNNIEFKTLVIDEDIKLCYIDNNPIDLTKTEFELLEFLLKNRNKIHSREEIMQNLSSRGYSPRTIDTNVTRLRKKLGEYEKHLITRRGFGYGFKEEL